ncbi:FAD-dependent oxidoreductase [Mycobacterium palustre]|uniref:2-polyprenyl-6-methoxyphenol hydroxylase-like oxidoreductase n=1 Tax=Mycobacterium palustre TaxID=153971 RepID=A0A1X1ZSJ5_9MYCO|nr:FAD-binding protein [Mycobacterium palustre]MCV7100264.1 FAD-binding protein [Mycobacterium palustre]ORW26228.1 2-polyprenyl-6-methoxyphenol hydroxylase-like oxidoreductase [Mycobacterium palustre]
MGNDRAPIGGQAVVLGASMAGLLAARTLADFFDTVTVVERDPLPDTTAGRRGVPQGRHLHALLARGAQTIEELFPGVLDELVRDGAQYFDGQDLSRLHYSLGGHLMARSGRAPSFTAYCATRPFLEGHVRRRVRGIPNVTLLDEHSVASLTWAPDRRRVTGARVVDRHSGEGSTLKADLVVDATGRGAHTPTWLADAGFDRPREDRVAVHLTYMSQRLRVTTDPPHEDAFLVGIVPGRPRGAGLLHCENDTWLFTVIGVAGHEPAADLGAMCEFVRDCAPAELLAAVRGGEPVGDPVRHKMPCSRWRRYDKARRFPEGLLVTGDAVCSFNPLYGQGMTVAALEASALRDCLGRGTGGLARRFFRAAAAPIRQAWQLSALPDLCLPEIDGAPPLLARALNVYMERVLTAVESDTAVVDQFTRVISLLDPATRLLRPEMVWRVVRANRRRRQSGIGERDTASGVLAESLPS